MFTTGMSPLLGESFMVLTMIISVPTSLLFVNWLGTLWRGVAAHGDADAVLRGAGVHLRHRRAHRAVTWPTSSRTCTCTTRYFVVGHFHLIMAAALLLASFAAVYFWFPKMFGRMMSERLGKLHFWPTFVSLNLVFVGQLLIGYAGMQRRLYDPSAYEFLRPLLPWNRWISRAAYVLGAAQLVFVVNFFWSLLPRPPGAGQPLAGRHARVDGAVAAAAPQLRSHPRGRARAARARRSDRRARAARTGSARTRSSTPPSAPPRREEPRA